MSAACFVSSDDALEGIEQSRSVARVVAVSDRRHDSAPWVRRGMSVTSVASGSLDALLANLPDAIVLDATAGREQQVAGCWRLHDRVQIPLIVVAEGASSVEAAALLDRGAADVVTEPPDDFLLAARTAAVLRRSRGHSPVASQLLRFSGAEVDLGRRQVLRADGPLTLSRTEFRLLQALLQAGGRACTHAELVTRVWGAECASATHYLRLYVRYLRQKIEENPMCPRNLLNVRGVGYRLIAESPRAVAGGAALSGAATR